MSSAPNDMTGAVEERASRPSSPNVDDVESDDTVDSHAVDTESLPPTNASTAVVSSSLNGVEDKDDNVAGKSPGRPRRTDQSQNPKRIFVGNIPRNCQAAELGRVIGDAVGPPSDIKIIIDKETGHSRGYGFLTFESEELARKCLGMQSISIKNKILNFGPARRKANKAHPTSPRFIASPPQPMTQFFFPSQPQYVPAVGGQPYLHSGQPIYRGYLQEMAPQPQHLVWGGAPFTQMWIDPAQMQPGWDGTAMMHQQYYLDGNPDLSGSSEPSMLVRQPSATVKYDIVATSETSGGPTDSSDGLTGTEQDEWSTDTKRESVGASSVSALDQSFEQLSTN